MTDRFVRRLYQFARAVDNIDDGTLERVERTLNEYFTVALHTSYYEVCCKAPPYEERSGSEADPNLQILWCMIADRRKHFVRLTNDDGSFYSQKAFVFCRRTPIWITPRDEGSYLRDCKDKADMMVQCTNEVDPPPYRDYEDNGDSKTAVVFPLNYEKQTLGVIDVEFPRLVSYGREAREHMRTLCDAIAIVIGRHRATRQSTEHTREAFSDLRQDLSFDDECGLPTEKEQVFLSYSSRADPAVIGELKRVLRSEKYQNMVSIEDWELDAQPGLITAQIVNHIRSSRFGICYLSEPNPNGADGGKRYGDNPNVLFEAGMLHVLRHNRGESLEGWLPIRESADWSGTVPFNFAGDRILIVPRDDRGELIRELFVDRLERHLARLFGS